MTALLLFAIAASAWGQSLQFEVRHQRALLDHPGRITVDDGGLLYEQVLTPKQQKKVAKGKKPPKLESARWDYQDIQQLWLSPDKLVVVTYKDRKWFLGVDKEFEFYLTAKDQSFTAVYERLKGKLDERFVAALADPAVAVEWEIPVKLLGAVQGSEGVLQIGQDRIVYQTGRKHHSRTWRLEDIENVSTSGPYQLTLTTHERAITHYGGLKGFNFQLKRKLDTGRFERLWKRLNRDKGLEFLTSLQERKQ
ncbi:MAG: hypothetical protein K2X35_06790 [Bryobacteraceae bacterium]|nr:hypothetical protein [Bryobacteraceae bacterium]